MRNIDPGRLRSFVEEIFQAADSEKKEAELIAGHLVDANLVGHDSHGIVRVHKYLDWKSQGHVWPNQHAEIIFDRSAVILVEGGFGYGQVIGCEAMEILADRVRRESFALLAIRNASHLGRIGAWPEQLAAAGLVSVHFVNTSGFGILVAPHGGSDRRLSANPIAAGAPRNGAEPLILDIATSMIAEGKIQMIRNRGGRLPGGSVLDGSGQPTIDPDTFYGDPPGAILPFGAHKGSGLSVFCELLAGSLTGGFASNPESPTADRLVNNMLSIAFDPDVFGEKEFFASDLQRLVAWATGSPPVVPELPVLVPGEIEAGLRNERIENGIPVDEVTLEQLMDAAKKVGIEPVDL